MTADCQPGPGVGGGGRPSTCALQTNPPGVVPTGTPNVPQPAVQYLPAQVSANTANVCTPGCASGSDYQSSIQCADMNTYQCGGNTPNAFWDPIDGINPNGPNFSRDETNDAVECLIHATATGLGNGQDAINWGNWPTNPMQITPSGSTNLMSTSSSIVTIPIIDVTAGAFNNPIGSVTIIGFLQAFVEQIDRNNNIQIKVMNVVGCSSAPNASAAITGGNNSSPISIRLITPP